MTDKKEKRAETVTASILVTLRASLCLSVFTLLAVIGTVIASLVPPLVLADIIDRLSRGETVALKKAILYFALIALSGLLQSCREVFLTILGQKITHGLRSRMSLKLMRLPASALYASEPGRLVSRFVGDADTVEKLFTSGIVSLFADACRIVSILVIIFTRNLGLGFILCLVLPLVFLFTRHVQKSMLKAHVTNRAAVSRVTNHVPETIRTIRTIHTLGKEEYMKSRYDGYIAESYEAIDRTNFYDALYSPVIYVINAVTVAAVMLLSSSGNAEILAFFGMSVGTCVAVINYISQIFSPIESLGMEIQTIQSAVAGVKRINEFLAMEEDKAIEAEATEAKADRNSDKKLGAELTAPAVEVSHLNFGYDDRQVLNDVNINVERGEQVTLAGRTGAGKSTLFKLILGLYRPGSGSVSVFGRPADTVPACDRRSIFGYVEQSFHMVPGNVRDQITLFDESIGEEAVMKALDIAGLKETVEALDKGLDTPCTKELFSQGQWQLLSIARAVAGEPEILLLDEITANLDAETEAMVLEALKRAADRRTVISISHRIYSRTGGRIITIGASAD